MRPLDLGPSRSNVMPAAGVLFGDALFDDVMVAQSRVLCVDDDALVLRAVARVLSAAPDLRVDTASDVDEARALLRTGEYAVLVTDHDMPGESGVALIESIESWCDAVPVLLTAHADLDVALDAINRGHVYAFIRKPCAGPELIATVHRAAERFELGRALHRKIAELEQANEELTRRNAEIERTQQELRRLRDMASIDEKTGAHTYRYFCERLDEEIARAERYELPLALLLFDLDGFKAANDRLGHLAGDAVLHDFAAILRRGVRVMDIVARFGGDEFLVLLPNTTKVGAAVLAERLRVRIAAAALGEAAPGEVTVSVGVASIPDETIASAKQLVEAADRALYSAKSSGRNRCALASPEAVGSRDRA